MRTIFRANAAGVTQQRDPNTVRFTDKPVVKMPRVLTLSTQRAPMLLSLETKSD